MTSSNVRKLLAIIAAPTIGIAALLFVCRGDVATLLFSRDRSADLAPQTLILNSQHSIEENVEAAFLEAAFTASEIPKWPEEAPISRNSYLEDVQKSFQIDISYPWFYEFIYREKGEPKPFALNKWNGPVVISTGFPNDLKPFVLPNWTVSPSDNWWLRMYRTRHPEVEATIADEVEAILPPIAQATKLDISFLPHDRETLQRYGNIRIIVLDEQEPRPLETPFKQGEGRVVITGEWGPKKYHANLEHSPHDFRSFAEPEFSGLVRFTPQSNQNVDGFFVPNAENEIELAVCYIRWGHSRAVLKRLVHECILRSLGLPGLVTSQPNTLLGSSIVSDDVESSIDLTELDKAVQALLYDSRIRPQSGLDDAQKAIQTILGSSFQTK